MSIGERIRSRRMALKMSQDELAKKLGYSSRSAINKIEKGINDVSQSKLFDFAKALRTTPTYLLGYSEGADAKKSSEKYFDAKFNDGTSMTVVTDSQALLERFNKWSESVGEFHFTDDEMEDLMNYAKFILMKRK